MNAKDVKELCQQWNLTILTYKPNNRRLYKVMRGETKLTDYMLFSELKAFLSGYWAGMNHK